MLARKPFLCGGIPTTLDIRETLMLIKRTVGFILISIISLLISYGFNSYFFSLPERPPIDQKLLIFFLACALTFVIFFIWIDGLKIELKSFTPQFNFHSLRENVPGIFLTLLFILIYFYFGNALRDFGINQVDNLFDADVSSWIRRIASNDVKNFEMRGPHPFTYFIFRPFGLFLNTFTKNPVLSAILFNAVSGGLCVFVMWLFAKRQFQNKVYAFLMAALLGTSASHFFFGSVVETYIHSALALMFFFLLIQSNQSSTFGLVIASIFTFGITLTNFLQNVISFIVARPRLKDLIRFTGWTISISLILTYIHAIIYPASKLFFLIPNVENEDKFFLDILLLPEWHLVGRLMYLARTMLLYSVVAPKVFILTEEVGSTLPEFRFYKISPGTFHQTNYEGLGQVLVLIWAIMLATAGIVFLWRLISEKKLGLTFSLILCLLLNFLIHINYGQEVFLYSPDWTYALVLFTAFGLSPFAKNRFFQAGLLIFLVLLAYNQWHFMQIILQSLEKAATSIG